MEGEIKERWFQLAQLAAVEQDPEKLIVLVQEINRLLDEKEERPESKAPRCRSYPTLQVAIEPGVPPVDAQALIFSPPFDSLASGIQCAFPLIIIVITTVLRLQP